MEYRKFTEVENHYRTKHIDLAMAQDPQLRTCKYINWEKLDGCLDAETLIDTKEYGLISIANIVDNKLNCHVMSYNVKTNELEWDIIVGHSAEENIDKQWYEIILGDNSSIKITGNHLVWMPKKQKYIRADELIEGDFILKK